MRKLYFSCLLLAAIFTGCHDVENAIIDKVEQKCDSTGKNKCIIALNDLTKFEWDRFYLFEAWTTSDSIAIFTGMPYTGNDVPDDYTRMLFVNKGKIVHEEDFTSLSYRTNTIIFQTDSGETLYTRKNFITPSHAKFKVEKSLIEHSCNDCLIFSLTPL